MQQAPGGLGTWAAARARACGWLLRRVAGLTRQLHVAPWLHLLALLVLGLPVLQSCAPSGLVAEMAQSQQVNAPAPAGAARPAAAPPPIWAPLARDGVHDPTGPGITLLQQPAEALAALPPDTAGNMVRWVQALDNGVITPRSSILPGTEVRLREDDIIIARYGSMPAVKFPHRQHTLWLDCSNCHPAPFKDKIGANRFSMLAILNGEQCGLCHGAVSFPLTECNRCHSVPNDSLRPRASGLP
jgi:c(7)-type cytochrome triheme protein